MDALYHASAYANPCPFADMCSTAYMGTRSNVAIVLNDALMINARPCIYDAMLAYISLCIDYCPCHHHRTFTYLGSRRYDGRWMDSSSKFDIPVSGNQFLNHRLSLLINAYTDNHWGESSYVMQYRTSIALVDVRIVINKCFHLHTVGV